MATVLRKNGFIVRIWSNDHLPRHVHIFKGGGTCTINLEGENGLPELREFYKMNRKEIAKALQLVMEHQEELIGKWDEIWGGR
jgi:hypothetical protein